MNKGNAAANALRMNVSAATADAATGRNVSMVCTAGQRRLFRRAPRNRYTYVVERALEDWEEAGAYQEDANARNHPMGIRIAGPRKDEEAGSEAKRTRHHWIESRFGHRPALILSHGTDVELLIETVRTESKDASEKKCNKGQRSNDRGPASLLLEDDGYRRQAAVDESVDEARVKGHEKAGRVDDQLERADQILASQFPH